MKRQYMFGKYLAGVPMILFKEEQFSYSMLPGGHCELYDPNNAPVHITMGSRCLGI
jgi:hypothetical protein